MKMTNSSPTQTPEVIDCRRLLRPDELAAFLGIPLATIYRWRSRGDGPRGIRVGRHVRYRVEEVERWLHEHEGQRRSPSATARK